MAFIHKPPQLGLSPWNCGSLPATHTVRNALTLVPLHSMWLRTILNPPNRSAHSAQLHWLSVGGLLFSCLLVLLTTGFSHIVTAWLDLHTVACVLACCHRPSVFLDLSFCWISATRQQPSSRPAWRSWWKSWCLRNRLTCVASSLMMPSKQVCEQFSVLEF